MCMDTKWNTDTSVPRTLTGVPYNIANSPSIKSDFKLLSVLFLSNPVIDYM